MMWKWFNMSAAKPTNGKYYAPVIEWHGCPPLCIFSSSAPVWLLHLLTADARPPKVRRELL